MLWFGMLAPPGTPPDIAQKISGATAEALKQPDVAAWLAQQGFEASGSTPAQMAHLIRQDNERWGRVIRAVGITTD